MPSVSDKQRRFMHAVAHDPAFAAKAGVPMPVGIDYNRADTGMPRIEVPGGAVRKGGFMAKRRP